ncbi:MAG: hypothetical protein IT249_04465 [Chitinophagaceae bacterium]|nr:hypothetical protein [Chitinophagaceae bacterium]
MDKIFEIEERYPEANNLQVNGINIWPLYRYILRFLLIRNSTASKIVYNKSNLSALFHRSYNSLKIFGKIVIEIPKFKKWFSRYDYIVFSNSLEHKKIGDITIDKLATGIINELGESKVLLINYPGDIQKKQSLSHKYVLDGSIINQIARLFVAFTIYPDSKRDTFINGIKLNYNLFDTGINDIYFFFRKNKVLSFLLKRWQPKCIFTSCYTYYSEVYTSKKLGIKTVELQHGIISPLHPGYESRLKLNQAFTADSLWTFGKNSIRDVSNNVIERAHISIIGNYYIEKLATLPYNEDIIKRVSQFRKSVCIPTDYITETHILEFIIPVASTLKDIGFFVIPRASLSETLQQKIKSIKNIIIVRDTPFQEFVRHCTFHTATNSTCCLEALSLGVRNILINDDNVAYQFYSQLTDTRFTKFVLTIEEYITAVETNEEVSKEYIIQSNKDNFSSGYKDAIKIALKQIPQRNS